MLLIRWLIQTKDKITAKKFTNAHKPKRGKINKKLFSDCNFSTGAYSETCQRSKMEPFAKIVCNPFCLNWEKYFIVLMCKVSEFLVVFMTVLIDFYFSQKTLENLSFPNDFKGRRKANSVDFF